MVKGVNIFTGCGKKIGDCRVLHMMSEVLAECLKSVLLTCAKTEKGHCMPSLKHLD